MNLIQRPRRLRGGKQIRSMVRETELLARHLVLPLFVVEGEGIRKPIASMPGVFHYSVDQLLKEAERIQPLQLGGVILFGIPDRKDDRATSAYAADGIIQRALRALRERFPDLYLITDVCLCEYMSHGHCGVVEKGEIQNDPTLSLLAKTAVSHVQAGAHMVAPSDMMDGRVRAIRSALDENGFVGTPILAYAVKYASAFYGPFREAAQSQPRFGDRKTYQMDPANRREALREARLDLREGADIVMVKPAGYYLDILAYLREHLDAPLAAYQVSGEYAMIKAAAGAKAIDENGVVLESLLSIRRAGAQFILTYFAAQVASLL